MHSLLETYLSEVASQLSAMPVTRRNEELREMRTHLENAVIVNREMGQSEDEAAQTAVGQFGPSNELAHSLAWAWGRGERKRNKGPFWRTIGGLAALCVYEGFQHPHGVDGTVIFFLGAVALCGWQHLPPKYVPAWWAPPTRRPLPWTLRLLVLAIGVFMGLNPFSMPYSLWMYVFKPILGVISLFIVFYGCYREYQKDTAAITST